MHVVLSDGALWNWQLIKEHDPDAVWILDFWHAAQRLSQAADAIFAQRRAPRSQPGSIAGRRRCVTNQTVFPA
jgi:hypothetical protein